MRVARGKGFQITFDGINRYVPQPRLGSPGAGDLRPYPLGVLGRNIMACHDSTAVANVLRALQRCPAGLWLLA